MGVQKFSPFLALGILLLYQTCSLQAAPFSVTAQKRACKTATCVTQRLADLLSRSGGMLKSNFVPTDVGSKAFGRHRRDLQA
ncbi:calcitonin gene-related peptide 2-like [Echinops telfairi]|uniref:Calcitonin gene-related peptide 2-like n=1 Tax=Echinops telfairi TaxID=9371 RepID=A0ABM0IZT7_ECHTE|nr:calcitonin gene-related peptide 2-like [Echinops telfairi]